MLTGGGECLSRFKPAADDRNVTSEAEAVPIADQYCKAQGKAALFNKMVMLTYHHVSSNSASFDCVTSAS
jgi:hypothetical protein